MSAEQGVLKESVSLCWTTVESRVKVNKCAIKRPEMDPERQCLPHKPTTHLFSLCATRRVLNLTFWLLVFGFAGKLWIFWWRQTMEKMGQSPERYLFSLGWISDCGAAAWWPISLQLKQRWGSETPPTLLFDAVQLRFHRDESCIRHVPAAGKQEGSVTVNIYASLRVSRCF